MMTSMKKSIKNISLVIIGITIVLTSCIRDKNSPGYEYMPDMYRSPALEAYVDYGTVRDSMNYDLMNKLSVRKPAQGSIAFSEDPNKAQFNMSYNIPNTPEGYELAGQTVISPIAFNKETVEKGKDLYVKFCQHCHGEGGAGDGKVVVIGGHPAPGSYSGSLANLPEGKMFHTLTYGKGVMGQHASQLNKEERWKVISYVKVLQGTLNEDGSVKRVITAIQAADPANASQN
jgi:mono/diheme cytochrome c family protein